MSELKDYLWVMDGERLITNLQFNQCLLMVSQMEEQRQCSLRDGQNNLLVQLLQSLVFVFLSVIILFYFISFIFLYFNRWLNWPQVSFLLFTVCCER